MDKNKQIILVNDRDREIGYGEKLDVHQKGLLHRAFSVFVFNDKKELLLQKRAKSKYHSGGLWSNTCCSHPQPNENLISAARRRLREEMDFDCQLTEVGSFTYLIDFGNLKENEFDHVLIGNFNGEPKPDPKEVEDWLWINLDELRNDLIKNPSKYTFWLKPALEKIEKWKP